MNRRHALKVLGAAALPALGWPMSAMAGEFPQKPIRFISPSPPGGVTDFLPRLLGQEMSKILGQPVVIENRTGGNQTIASRRITSPRRPRTDTPSCSPRRARWRSTRI
ncbi:hypothetical protein ACL7BY_06335 [Bordetella pertussis]